ncbi:hypothetical protein [Jannaschia sp. R86511]|uniref:hypothetical protein n=1 Tax=Jannaschia sp. R86511 TaxID=3093853 RepID=UPI0036D354B1
MSEAAVPEFDPVLMAGVLEQLTDQVEAMQTMLEAVVAQVAGAPAGEGRWLWRALSGGQAAALLDELRDFVDWLVRRYQLGSWRHSQLPGCWYAHPVAVEELTGLMLAHRAAHPGGPQEPSDAPAAWHERWLWPTLRRLDELGIFKGCEPGRHTDRDRSPEHPTDDGYAAARHVLAATPAATADDDNRGDSEHDPDGPGTDEESGRPGPGVMTDGRVAQLVATGSARRLFPDDEAGPVLIDGRWWAIPADTTTDDTTDVRFVALDDERDTALRRMDERLQQAKDPR